MGCTGNAGHGQRHNFYFSGSAWRCAMTRIATVEELFRANPELASLNVDVDKPKKEKRRGPPSTDAEKAIKKAKREVLEHKFDTIWRQLGGEPDFWEKVWIPGYDGYEERYELDRYNDRKKVAVEIQGGQWMEIGGHKSGTGLGRDARKAFRCNAMGIQLFPVTTDMVTHEWVAELKRIVDRIVFVS